MESLVVLLLVCFGVASCAVCGPDRELFEKASYCMVDSHIPWVSATTACSSMGGRLAVPNSQAEQAFLYDFAAQHFGIYSSIWIDCSKTSTHGQWMHADGSPCEYTNFIYGDVDGANCVHMYLNSGYWFAVDCSANIFPVVCELPLPEGSSEEVKPSMFCMEFGADGRLHP
ncbi:collectin-10-like [Patiria miniata]|uniref:C-type lectin domain-containing protein n=1 Tax=Patiria miniata TaxID=46514 RepID=A0A914BA38_PATMI|nr:collectin-10-like [Patiria miniata]